MVNDAGFCRLVYMVEVVCELTERHNTELMLFYPPNNICYPVISQVCIQQKLNSRYCILINYIVDVEHKRTFNKKKKYIKKKNNYNTYNNHIQEVL